MSPPPREWIDSNTGRRILRLSSRPGTSSQYFNVNGYTPEGDFLIVTVPGGLDKIYMETQVISDCLRIGEEFKLLFVGLKQRRAYYQTLKDNIVHYVNIDTGETVEIAQAGRGDIQSINCDETLLAGVERDPNSSAEILKLFEKRDKTTDQFDYRASWPDGSPMSYADAKEVRLNERLNAKVPMKLFVIDTATGTRRDVYGSTDWLNHLLFSPSNPDLLM